MSDKIDWSKAPADATHYNTETEGWYKQGVDAYRWDGRKWYFVCADLGQIKFSDNLVERQTTPSWSGEGLPPAGVVCEVAPDNDLWGFSTLEVRKCIVIAYHADFVWLDTFVPGIPVATRVDKVTFRPIRTHEQIEADERSKAIDEMVKALGMDGPGTAEYIRCGLIYDAGFRKQEKS